MIQVLARGKGRDRMCAVNYTIWRSVDGTLTSNFSSVP